MDTITITVAENDPDVVVNATLNEDAVTITINEAAVGATGPAGADGGTSDVKSASFTAANDKQYTVVATLTVTDPSPVEGKGFEVFLRNGTATIGGTAYTRSGTTIRRVFHSGAWTNTPYVSPIVSADISDATSAATANKVVIRDVAGGAEFGEIIAGSLFTTATDGSIFTVGTDASIFTNGTSARIYTTGASADISSENITASVKSTNFAAFYTSGASLKTSAGTAVLTWGESPQNLTVTAGTGVTFNATSYTFGTGAAAAMNTALGLTALATTTPGTGVATALAVNVGTAGAFVVNGGALGTPNAGTLTSCTGLPISTGVSGLGTGVATLLTGTPSGTGGPVGTTSPTITTPSFTRATSGQVFSATGSLTESVTFTTDTSGRTFFTISGNPSATGATGGSYVTAQGVQEGWMYVNATGNTTGLRVMRFGNLSNRFSIQRLNDTNSSITATPFSIANDAPTNAFYMNSSGGVTLGATTDAGATNLLVSGSSKSNAGFIYGTFTVGTFPSTTYLEAVVTDALTPVIGAAVAAGGSAKCKVMYNGSAKIVTAVL